MATMGGMATGSKGAGEEQNESKVHCKRKTKLLERD